MKISFGKQISRVRRDQPNSLVAPAGHAAAENGPDAKSSITALKSRLSKGLLLSWLGLGLAIFSPSAPAQAEPPQLADHEMDVIGDMQIFTIAHLQQLRLQAKTYASCYENINSCPNEALDEFKQSRGSLPQILSIYRRWMGLVRIKDILNYRRTIDSLIDGLPPLEITREEAKVIRAIHEKNEQQITQEWRQLTPAPHHYLKKPDRYVDFNEFKINREAHIKALYLKQIGELLQDKPYILYIQGANPSDRELAEIFAMSVAQLDDEIARIKESQDAREMLELTPIVRRYYNYLVETEQEQRERVLIHLKHRFDRGEFDDGFFEENKWTLGFAACTVIGVAISKSPNLATLACGSGGVIVGSVNLYASVNRYLIARNDWLYGLRSIDDLDQPKAKAVQSVLLLMLSAQSAWLSNRALFKAEALPNFTESMKISVPYFKSNFASVAAFEAFAKTASHRVSVSLARKSSTTSAKMVINPLVEKVTQKIRLPDIKDFLTALVAEGKVASYQTMRRVGLIPAFS